MYHTLLNWAIPTEHYQASDVEYTSNKLYSTVLVECFSELLVKLLSHNGVMWDTPCRPVARGSWPSWLVSCLKPPIFEEDNKFYSGNFLSSFSHSTPTWNLIVFMCATKCAYEFFSFETVSGYPLNPHTEGGDSLPDSPQRDLRVHTSDLQMKRRKRE